jgi:hypothetical protein
MDNPTFMSSNLFNEFTLFHPEVPLTAVTGQPDIYMVGAAWVLWNEPTSNQIIYFKNLKIINQMSQDTATGTSKLDIQRVTGYTTSSMTATAAYVAKMDSTNPDLPSQVKCLTRLDTVTGGTVTRSFMNAPNKSMGAAAGATARTVAFDCSKNLGSTASGLNRATVQSCGYGNDSVQPWTMNEGEGIAIVPATIQTNAAYRMSITFTTGSGTYIMAETLRPFAVVPSMMLYNGSDSGVILKAYQIECQEIGPVDICNFAIQKVDGISPEIYGTDVTSTIFSMDSSNSLPSGIKMYEDCLVSLYGSKYGAFITNPSFRRNVQQWLGTGPTWAIGTRMYGIVTSSDILDNSVNPVVLRPGEGLALLQKNASGIGRYGASVLFQTEAIPHGGSQAHASVC